jgi:MFS family permease
MILAGALMTGLAARFSVPACSWAASQASRGASARWRSRPPWALLLVLFAVGWFVMPVQATTMTIVQSATSDESRGRVAGALNAAIQTASIGSMAAAGILADVIGIRWVFAAGGAVVLLAAVVAWLLFRGESQVAQARSRRRPDGSGAGWADRVGRPPTARAWEAPRRGRSESAPSGNANGAGCRRRRPSLSQPPPPVSRRRRR